MDERELEAELRLDSKLFSAVTCDNASNFAHLNKKNKKKYANSFDPEKELHPDNVEFLQQVQSFSDKITAHGVILEEINSRILIVGRENIVLDPLYEILQILTSCQEKINTEACRIGACTKRIVVPETRPELNTAEVMHLIMSSYAVIKKQYEAIIKFVRKYINNKYLVSSYMNMNRLIKAEIDINDSTKEANKIFKVINFLRFQNAAVTVNAALKWLKKARNNIRYKKNNRINLNDDDSNQLWNNESLENDPSIESAELAKHFQTGKFTQEGGTANKMPVFQLKRNK